MGTLTLPVARAAVAGWGRFPVRPGRVVRPERLELPAGESLVLPRGLGRAYGDAAVPWREATLVLETGRADRILDWDPVTGRLTAEAGLSLSEVLRLFVPRGWFPPVTPGTKFVTLGGCVATDVHGKNHHRDGSFASFVDRLTLLTAEGKTVACGPDLERELFLATVGGMGLTGLITEVTLRLRPVESGWIVMESEGVPDLDHMVSALESSGRDWPYTVGWIDCLASGAGLGRGVLLRGRHAARAEVPGDDPRARRTLRVPLDAPEWLLSPPAMRAFNGLYYWLKAGRRGGGRAGARPHLVSYESFFYPLDALGDWNRLYGRRGFLQYQCVVPRAVGRAATRELLERLAHAGAASFLAVIKDCGPAGPAPLSFPLEGITLALDLPHRGPPTVALVHELNATVMAAGGRIYLAKDAVTRAEDFARMTPRLAEWQALRDRWDPARRFRSAMSVRLFGDGVDWRAAAAGEASGYGGAFRAERGGRAAAAGEASGYMKAVFVGATRGMGKALARRMAERADALYLLGRDAEGLALAARDLEARGARAPVRSGPLDLGDPGGFVAALDAADAALDRFDTLVITAGLFGAQDALAADAARLERLFSVNFTGTALLCQLAADRLAERGGGVICAFSSVAGDRARAANYLYGASKAGLSAFLDGLGLAYADRDVRVVCVRPGFVRTEMTAGLPEPPFAGEPDTVATSALRAMDAGSPRVYSPGIWRWIMGVIRALPRSVVRRLRV